MKCFHERCTIKFGKLFSSNSSNLGNNIQKANSFPIVFWPQSKLKILLVSFLTNQKKEDQPTFRAYNLESVYRLYEKNEAGVAKMQREHAVTLISFLLATVFAHNVLDAKPPLL